MGGGNGQQCEWGEFLMAGISFQYYRNYNSTDTTFYIGSGGNPLATVDELGWSAPSGKVFKEWNTLSDETGTSFSPGSYNENGYNLYAIWEVPVSIDYLTTDQELTSVANAIRTKGGTSASLVYPTGFVSAIEAISSGTDVSDTTATAGDVRTGKYFYTSAGVKTQGTIADQAAQTITPTTTDQTIASGKYLTGAQTIKGDANLVAANIAKDVTIFGVTGTHEGGGGGGGTMTAYSASNTPAPSNYKLTFTGVTKEPLAFFVNSNTTNDMGNENQITQIAGIKNPESVTGWDSYTVITASSASIGRIAASTFIYPSYNSTNNTFIVDLPSAGNFKSGRTFSLKYYALDA